MPDKGIEKRIYDYTVAFGNQLEAIISTDTAAELRRFTRYFSRVTGLLRGRLYDVDLSLTEARVLFEVAQAEFTTAEAIRSTLDLDKGYVSRTIAGLEKRGWIGRQIAGDDRRARSLTLTQEGRDLFSRINQRSTDEMEQLVVHLGAAQRNQLSEALSVVDRLLIPKGQTPKITIRDHRIGDLGWIVHRHGVLYAEEYGWDITFEGAVAEIAAGFIKSADPAHECCLVAEIDSIIAGSATVVRLDEATAKLRIVYVEPWARGHGLGETLVSACMRFARDAGYCRMKLWTNDVLKPARRLYERLGFALVESEPHRSFGKDLVGEVWERAL
jgi:DNA-binding MarR family transcriptional regulator/GNAT superfamily N-acetyltransferase